MTFMKKTLAASTALALVAAPAFSQTTPTVNAEASAEAQVQIEKDGDNGVNSVGDALGATGDFATDTVGGAVNLAGDAVTATGEFVAGTGSAITGLLEGPGADMTTTATVYRFVPAEELDARVAKGTPVTGLDNASLIGEYVTTLDGTQIGRIGEVERTEAGALQTLTLDTNVTDAEFKLMASATTKTDDGIILALTDAEFVAIVEATAAD
jgi:hypothetical protein